MLRFQINGRGNGVRRMATVMAVLVFAVSTRAVDAEGQDRRPGFRQTVFALEGATLVTGPGEVIEDGTLVLRDGVIAAVGAAGEVDVPYDAERIDGTGLVAYAGFIDAYAEMGVDEKVTRSRTGGGRTVDYSSFALGATPADNRSGLTPEFRISDALALDDEKAKPRREAGFTAALAAPSGGVATGQSAVVSLNGLPRREVILASPTALHVALRSTGALGYPSTTMGFVSHLRQAFLDAGHNQRSWEFFREHGGARPPVDPTYEALREAQQGKLPVFWRAETRDEILRAIDLADEFGVDVTIVGGGEAWRVADELAAKNIAVVLEVDFPKEPKSTADGSGGGDPYEERLRSLTLPAIEKLLERTDLPTSIRDRLAARAEELKNPGQAKAEEKEDEKDDKKKLPESPRVLAEMKREWLERVRCAETLAAKGVRFCFTTHGHDKPSEFAAHVQLMVEKGLSMDDAVAALTSSAAEILGVENQLGRLAAGKAAHVVVFDKAYEEKKAKLRYAFVDAEKFELNRPADDVAKAEEDRDEEQPEDAESAEGEAESAEDADAEGDEGEKEEAKPEEASAEAVAAALGGGGEAKEPFRSETEADREASIQTGGDVAIRGATILTVTEGTHAPGTVVVQNGKITAVGADVNIPDGITVIDGAGLFVMPGIIDTHSHFSISGGVNESSLAVVPEVRIRDVVNGDDLTIYRALAGGVTAARLLHGSANPIGGQDGVIKLRWGLPARDLIVDGRPRGVKFALGENPKRSSTRYPDTRLGVESSIRRALEEARMYRRIWQRYALSRSRGENLPEPRRDLRLEALADIVEGELRIHSHCYRADEILMLLRLAESYGIRVASLQHVLEGYKVAAEIAAHGASNATFADWWAYKIEAYDAIPFNAAMLMRAGAEVTLKSDDRELMRHLYQDAAKCVRYGGLTETEALRLVTINAASQLGLADRMGSIEVGKDADLAIFNGHPLHGYARCEMTLVDGEVYFERQGEHAGSGFDAPIPEATLQAAEVEVAESVNGWYALRGGRIVPVVGEPIEDGTIVVGDGVIRAIGGPETDVPNEATVVELAGLSVYPGMINAGGALGLTEIGSAGETHDYNERGQFNEDLMASIGVHPDSEIIPVSRANGILTVLTRPSGGTISGQSVLMNLHGWIPPEMAVVDPAALHVNFPTGLYGSESPRRRSSNRKKPEERIEELKERFRLAVRYGELVARAELDGTDPPTPDPKLAALVPYAKGEGLVVIHAVRHGDILAAIEFAKEVELRWLLAGADDAWKCVEELKANDVGVLLGPSMQLPETKYTPYDAPYANAATLHEAGVRFAITAVGSGPGSATSTRNLPFEAAMAVSYGLPPEEGLKAVTLYPAELLGAAEKLGSLEVGKVANLVVADGDMLLPTSNVKALWIDGAHVAPESKHTELYARYQKRLEQVQAGRVMLGVSPREDAASGEAGGGEGGE